MGDSSYCVVRLDVLSDAEIAAAADRIEAFLRHRGVLGEPGERGWAPGPRYRDVLAPGAVEWAPEHGGGLRMDHVGWNHVEIDRRWGDQFAVDAFEVPTCPTCGTPAREADCYAGLEDWVVHRREPVLRCPACGTDAPQGDWVGDRANSCGAPRVVFNNWEELAPAFVAELRAVVGGRTQLVRQSL